jgi:hypothetical protein
MSIQVRDKPPTMAIIITKTNLNILVILMLSPFKVTNHNNIHKLPEITKMLIIITFILIETEQLQNSTKIIKGIATYHNNKKNSNSNNKDFPIDSPNNNLLLSR